MVSASVNLSVSSMTRCYTVHMSLGFAPCEQKAHHFVLSLFFFFVPLPHHLYSRWCYLFCFFYPTFLVRIQHLPLKLNVSLLCRIRQAVPVRLEALITFQIKASSVFQPEKALHVLFCFVVCLFVSSEDVNVRVMVFNAEFYWKKHIC